MNIPALRSLPASGKQLLHDLKDNLSGVAMIEFAFALPLLLSGGVMGSETAFLVITHMQVSQIAMQVADNASRVGEQDVLTARKVYDRDIAETLIGAEKLGEEINLFDQGRVIISSLQRNAQGGQWIAWQRCRGALQHESSFGKEGDGKTGTAFPGMGTPGRYITAAQGTAVMFVEVSYDYNSLTPFDIFEDNRITYTATFNVRDSRDLTKLYPGGPIASCTKFSAARPT